jgi:glucosamine--fructose-6-phosphate aminotransferase (isomerizing)
MTFTSSPNIGIGHTRWATHGKPTEINAHPHRAGRVSIIHNGIIENFIELRSELQSAGCRFLSETDTEIAAHLLNRNLEKGIEPIRALEQACHSIRGSYSFVAIDELNPDCLLVAKNATPMIIGLGEGEVLVASDIPALMSVTKKIIILEDGDIARLGRNTVEIFNGGKKVLREVQTINWDPITAQKGGYKHFMLKEINEQASVLSRTLAGRIDFATNSVQLPEITLTDRQIREIDRVVLVACGTAWHACLVSKFLIESLAGVPCEVDYASEFRYRSYAPSASTLVVAISQSGETADTLAALELAREKSQTLAICNVLASSITRKAGNVLFTHAGPEISVASTKAFTTQLLTAYLFAVHLGARRGVLSPALVAEYVDALSGVAPAVTEVLKGADGIQRIARKFSTSRDFLFLGRGILYPVALEGALKLKELSYIHAEGYPAGEMKHGPIALIDEKMPVVTLLQRSPELFSKSLSNLKEAEARQGRLIAITDSERREDFAGVVEELVELPFISNYLSPILFSIPLQLLAYHVAVQRGTDVDLPRNLAKSVTVE